MKKGVRLIKRALALAIVFCMSINSFAAIVADNDGSAFITKAEFDSLKNSFQSQIDNYNSSIDSKIDGAIAAYLAGIKTAGKYTAEIFADIDSIIFADRIPVYRSDTKEMKPEYGNKNKFFYGPYQYNGVLVCEFYPKLFWTDDSNESVFMQPSFKHNYTNVTDKDQCKNLFVNAKTLGKFDNVGYEIYVSLMQKNVCESSYIATNTPPSQGANGWRIADGASGAYARRVQIATTAADDFATFSAYAKQNSTTQYDDILHFTKNGWLSVGRANVSGSNVDVELQKGTVDKNVIKYLILGQNQTKYIATFNTDQTVNLQDRPGVGPYNWTNGNATTVDMTYVNMYQKSIGSATTPAPSWTGSTLKVNYPKWNYEGLLTGILNYTYALNGKECNLFGAWLFKAPEDGLAELKLNTNVKNIFNNTTDIKKTTLTIKKDQFTNSENAQGHNTDLLYSKTKTDDPTILAENIATDDGKFLVYFNVKKGDDIYIRLSQNDGTGENQVQITEASVNVIKEQ